jgi:hypothetical protein
MTGQAERIKEQHRGFRRAEPASQSRIAALNSFGLRYEQIDDFNVMVEGEYQLNLALSYWRAIDGSCHGYLVSALDAEIKKRNSGISTEGRDSVAASATSDTGRQLIAESSVGTPSLDELIDSSSLLPVVSL